MMEHVTPFSLKNSLSKSTYVVFEHMQMSCIGLSLHAHRGSSNVCGRVCRSERIHHLSQNTDKVHISTFYEPGLRYLDLPIEIRLCRIGRYFILLLFFCLVDDSLSQSRPCTLSLGYNYLLYSSSVYLIQSPSCLFHFYSQTTRVIIERWRVQARLHACFSLYANTNTPEKL